MSPAAVVTVSVLGVMTWGALATLLGIAIGLTIRAADRQELPPCCPHPEAEAPETVRGEFRALVIR